MKCILSPFRATTATKLRNFQYTYRLVNRVLTINMTRNKWSPNTSPLCTFCKKTNETTVHLLIECEYVKKLWISLSRWIEYFLKSKKNYKVKKKPSVVLIII